MRIVVFDNKDREVWSGVAHFPMNSGIDASRYFAKSMIDAAFKEVLLEECDGCKEWFNRTKLAYALDDDGRNCSQYCPACLSEKMSSEPTTKTRSSSGT